MCRIHQKANGLEVYEDLFDISARIIANRVSYKFNYDKIQKIIDLFDSTVKAREIIDKKINVETSQLLHTDCIYI